MTEMASNPLPEFAQQDLLSMGTAAAHLINAKIVLFDYDDTIVRHDPGAQYRIALHTLGTLHGSSLPLDGFTMAEKDGSPPKAYLTEIREASAKVTGDFLAFEAVANTFRLYPHDGDRLKAAIKSLPGYSSSAPFWEARAAMLNASGVSPAYGKCLLPGIKELLRHLNGMSKDISIISNSRADLVQPALRELLPEANTIFTRIVTLGDSDIPIKPHPAAYAVFKEVTSTDRAVYIGNAQEDIAFASAVSIPAIILSEAFSTNYPAEFVPDLQAFTRLIRRHSEVPTVARLAVAKQTKRADYSNEINGIVGPEEARHIVVEGIHRLWASHINRSTEAMTSTIWGRDSISLKNIENFCDTFGWLAGDIQLSRLSEHPILKQYYKPERYDIRADKISLRGSSYFAAVDETFITAENRVDYIGQELLDALRVFEQMDGQSLVGEDFLAYLGVLDNAKQQILTLFHAFSYNERRTGIPETEDYLVLREQLLQAAVRTTRSFYEASIGRPSTVPPSVNETQRILDDLQPYVSAIEPRHFKLQELDHPLRIMLSAYGFASSKKDTVIGFASGGTQPAIVTALAAELRHNKSSGEVTILSVPLSQHSGVCKEGLKPISDKDLQRSLSLMARDIKDRRVMIVDDNSSTGMTMRRGKKAVGRLSPTELQTGVCEIDPQRLLIRSRMAAEKGEVFEGVYANHSLFSQAAGVVPITRRDMAMRKLQAQQVLARGRKR